MPEPAREPAPRRPPPRPGRSGLRLLGRALLLLPLALALLVLALVIWLHTGSGRRTVASVAMKQARGALAGELRVGEVRIGGFLQVCVDHVELLDPDGHQVFTAQRACVALAPGALVSKDVVLREVTLEKPWLEIAKVPGTNET